MSDLWIVIKGDWAIRRYIDTDFTQTISVGEVVSKPLPLEKAYELAVELSYKNHVPHTVRPA